MRAPILKPTRWWMVSVTLACGLAGAVAQACLNSYSLDMKLLLNAERRPQALRMVAEIEREFITDKSLKTTNDLAVARILFGRYEEAITLLKDLETRHPGKAMTAANLGTAFELKGDDGAALQWIREGIRRDPREHRGSEWVHVRILEAKLELKQDPRRLDSHSVVGLDFGAGVQPGNPAMPPDQAGKPQSVADTRQAVTYQLFERIALVKPPDAIVADLYQTSGDLGFRGWLNNVNDERARNLISRIEADYRGALKYGTPRKALVEARLAEIQRLEAQRISALKKP
jgi:tetratricopeptide (TPR) repeat protein